MSARSKFYRHADGSRRRLIAHKLAEQIRASAACYRPLSDEEAITQYLELEMMTYRLDLSFHEAAVLLKEETKSERPVLPQLLYKALAYESRNIPRATYAAQALLLTQQTKDLEFALQDSEAEVKRLRETLERLEPHHPSRRN